MKTFKLKEHNSQTFESSKKIVRQGLENLLSSKNPNVVDVLLERKNVLARIYLEN